MSIFDMFRLLHLPPTLSGPSDPNEGDDPDQIPNGLDDEAEQFEAWNEDMLCESEEDFRDE